MKMKMLAVVLAVLLWSLAFCKDNVEINMILSYLLYESKPIYLITPKLCWEPYLQVELTKKLFQQNITTADTLLQLNCNEHTIHSIIVLVDLTCPGVDQFLANASVLGYFKSPYRWLILCSTDGDKDYSVFKNLAPLADSDVVLAKKTCARCYSFSEVYKISEHTNVIELPKGYWYAANHIGGHLSAVNYQKVKTINESKSINPNVIGPKVFINKYVNPIESEIILYNDKDTEIKPHDTFKRFEVTEFGIVIDAREYKIVSRRRHNLMKHTLTMANVIADNNETKYHLDDRLNLQYDSITKMSAMVVSVCFEILNATERRIFTNTWGYRDRQGNWQGVIELLLKNKADLGTLTIFTKERMETVDYIAMIGTTGVRFVFREPPLSYVSNIFALPFTAGVWLSILVSVLGCSLFLYVTSKWEASMGMHPLQLDGSWADVLILIIGAVLQQGCTLEPRYAAGRCVTLFVFLTLTILYAAYSANIVVLLRASSSSVRTLPDLLNSPLKIGASDFEYNRYFFKKLNDPIRKAIYDKKIAPKGYKPHFYSMKEGVEKIRQGLFAFHMETNPGYRVIQDTYKEDEKCDLVEIDFINEINPWVPGQKRSQYKELFKINFLRIRESGIQSCIHRRLNVPRPRCSGTIASFSSVGLRDIYPALLITLYGFLIAPALLLCEIFFFRLQLYRVQHNKKPIRTFLQ